MPSRNSAHNKLALGLEVQVSNLRQQALERIDQICPVATTLPFLREQIQSILRSNANRVSEAIAHAAEKSAQIDACPLLLTPKKNAPAIPDFITKEDFDSAVAAMIRSNEKNTRSILGLSRPEQCAEIARLALIGEINTSDPAAMAIVTTTAKRLWRGDGTLGLLSRNEALQ